MLRLSPGSLALRLRTLLRGLLDLRSMLLLSWLFNLGLSLLPLSLFLMALNLRPLMIFVLPLTSQFLSLGLRSRPVSLDAPGPSPFPVSIIMPALPVLVKSPVRNSFVVPRASVPVMVSVEFSPARVYIKIKAWDSVIINPTPVIMI
jgi:hypothetical protein